MLMMRNAYRWILAVCDGIEVRSYFKVEIATHAKISNTTELFIKRET